MQTRVTGLLKTEYPIIQGGMAWVADYHLAAAVSNGGGLGMICAANASEEWVAEQIREVRKRTDRPFGVNIMLMSPHADEVARTVARERVPVVTTGAGNPEQYMTLWKEKDIRVIPVIASVAMAKRMEKCGADAVVAEGYESGGHVGESTTMTLVPQVCDAVNIPVIAAGGIADGRGIAAALMLGAEGVQMGTRFVVTKECHIHPAYKERILKAKDIDTKVTGRSTGHPVRALRNDSHIVSKDRINEDTIWKKNFKFQPFDVNADAVISTPMQKVMDTAVMRSESRGGIVKLPEGDQAKDVTRYTDRIVNHMISHMVKRVREVLNKYVSITITDMTDLIPELLYYIKWAEYIQKLQEQGFTFAKASVYKAGENESDPYMMQARGIYNLKLAVFETEESGNIVPNDMDFDRNRRVYILTGANRGGKTTITQAVGQLFVLAQGGIYIPGKAFTFSPVTGIYTHFPADEDKTLDLGRLGEECKRFKAIYEEADSRSLLLMNESFSTTSFEEGYYIAKDSVRAILHKGMRTIYNTHMHKLAFDVEEMNEEQQKAEYTDGKAFSMIVHMKGTERSYQIEVAPPEGKSYASEIAQKYGVTYEMLVK